MTKELSIDCRACGAQLIVQSNHRTTQCPYCDSPTVIQRPTTPNRPDPGFVLGFLIPQENAKQHMRSWINKRWFVPSGFKKASIDHTRGVYLPAYLYGAVADSEYSASIGENYTTTETYTTTQNGKTVTRTRTVTKTEWRSLSGKHSCYIMDVIVTASGSISNQELEFVEPFDFKKMKRFHPGMIAGWIAEEPTIDQKRCLELAHKESLEVVGKKLEEFMPGDEYRDLQYHSHLQNQLADLILLPLWVFALRPTPESEPVRVVVNGQTGKTYGKLPLSWVKIVVLIATILLFLTLVVVASELGSQT